VFDLFTELPFSLMGYYQCLPAYGPGWGEIFPHPSLPDLGPNGPPIQWVKGPGRGINHLTSYSTEVEERVELYYYSPSGPSWIILGELYLYFSFRLNVSLVFRGTMGKNTKAFRRSRHIPHRIAAKKKKFIRIPIYCVVLPVCLTFCYGNSML
jgi:hypothetical protein